jgi:ATP-dependent DNA helicase RecG
MPFEVIEIDSFQVLRLLASREGQYLDFKAIDIAPGKITKHLSAFANADGGELFIGLDEVAGQPMRWRGFSTEENANGHVQAFEQFFPLGQDSTYDFISSKGQDGFLLHITVRKTKDVRRASDGRTFIRRNASSFPVDGEALKRLELDKGLVTFEN